MNSYEKNSENKNKRRVARIFWPRTLDIFSASKNGTGFSLSGEIFSGVTVGIIAIPLAIAIGIASVPAGVETPFPPPALGLFTAVVAGLLISLLGGSRVQIGGPTAAFIPVVLLVVEKHGYFGLLTATVMAGVMLVAMGLARMGALIKFIPWPVTSGFTTGIAISIIVSQLGDFLGVTGSSPREVPHKLLWLWENVGHTSLLTLGVGVTAIAIILLWKYFKIRHLPASIVAMLAATLAVAIFGWGGEAVATIGSKFGAAALPSGLPMPKIPVIEWAMIRDLMGPAMAIALLGAIESLLSAVVGDGLSGDRHDSNTELIAQGIANIVCPFFGGLPATGAIARTSANVANGAKTPISGIVHALTILVVVALFSPWAAAVPVVAMSAVLIMIAVRMGEWHELTRLHLMPRSDAFVLLTTLVLTVVFDLVVAVEVGMVFAAVLFIRRVSKTTEVSQVTADDVLETPEQLASGKKIPEDVLVYRIFGPFLFGAAEKMENALAALDAWPRVLILRLHLVTAMDATALHVLKSVVEQMQKHGGTVILSGLHHQPLSMLQRAGFVDVIGRKNLVAHFDHALERAENL